MTLGLAHEGRHALTSLRLVLALAVLLSHSWPLSGAGPDPQLGGVSLGGYAVYGFFALSGYVVTGSRLRHDLTAFLVHREARIFPGLWASLVVVAVIFAPVAAWAGAGAYGPWDAFGFVVRNVTTVVVQGNIGTLLSTAPVPWAWNGALWTISLEVACYGVAAAVFSAPLARRRPAPTAALLMVLTTAGTIGAPWDHPLDKVGWPIQLLRLLAFFAAGSLLWTLRDRVSARPAWALAAAAVALTAGVTGLSAVVAPLPYAYVLLSVARFLPDLHRDVSYGVYLYGFPVQQLLHQLLPSAHAWTFAALSAPPTLALGWLSWHVVERPALRWAASLRDRQLPRQLEAVPSRP
jgi:peptidoglycan/LPS O-acetylase OafA/YrhL